MCLFLKKPTGSRTEQPANSSKLVICYRHEKGPVNRTLQDRGASKNTHGIELF